MNELGDKTGPHGLPWCPLKCGCEVELIYGSTEETIYRCPKCGHEVYL